MSGSVYLTPFGRVKKFLFSQTLTEKITNSAILVIFVAFIVSEGLTTTFLFSGVLRIEMKAQLDKASTLLEYAQASPSSKRLWFCGTRIGFFLKRVIGFFSRGSDAQPCWVWLMR